MDKADDAASSESSTLTDTCVRLSLESGEELSVTMSRDSVTKFCEILREHKALFKTVPGGGSTVP